MKQENRGTWKQAHYITDMPVPGRRKRGLLLERVLSGHSFLKLKRKKSMIF